MGNPVGKSLFGMIMCALILTAFSGLSFAQEAPAEDQPGIEEETMEVPIAVGEITVTAQKREEDIQDVPVSVSVLNTEDLNIITTGGVDVRALSARVPSLIMESSFGRAFPRFYIRGLGNTDFDLNASQPVSMVVDEVVLENPVVKGMPLFDLDRVEVLRGPQGTLFGRNTPAGIVKFETVRPSQEFDAFVRASYGTYSTTDIQAAVGGSLGGGFSARASGLYQSRSDWVNNNFEGGDDLGGYTTTALRLQLLWEPNDKFSGLFKVHGWEVSDGTARIFRANVFNVGSSNLVSGFRQDQVTQNGLNTQEITSRGGLLRLEYDFGAATLTSITGYESIRDMYSRGDIDGGGFDGPGFIPFQAESADGMPKLDQWTQEFRLASNSGGAVNWLAGFFYFNEEVNIDSFSYDTYLPGNPQNGYSNQFQETKAYALFGSLNWAVSDSWDLAGGLRYSNDEKDFWVDRPQPVFQPPLVAPITENVSDSFVSWDLSATWKASQDVNVYARAAQGFRAPAIQGRIMFCADFEGGTNPATNCVTTADTESNLSFEVGVKSILAQNKLRLNLTGYIFEMSDQQLTAVGGEFNTATLLNAEKTKGHGIEADIEWIPSGHWFMTFGASWNPTEIVDPDLTVAPCGGGCTVTDPINNDGLALINGNSLPHAPEWIVNGIINFQSDPVKKSFFGSLDWAYHSEKHFFLYDSVEFNSDAFELGMRLGYAFHNAQYEVALFGRNILDAEIVRNGIDFNNLTGMMNDPRIIGIEFLAKF